MPSNAIEKLKYLALNCLLGCDFNHIAPKMRYNTSMLFLKEYFLHTPIMSLQTGAKLAETTEAIIDPRQLKIVAFYCDGPHLDVRPAILNVEDIREIGRLGIIVDDSDVLMSPNDLVRLQEIIGFNFKLDDKKVIDEDGKSLGNVANYTIDSQSLYIVKIQVKPKAFSAFQKTELIFDRTQIVEVTDHEVVVSNSKIKSSYREKAPILDNPFRTAQPESIEIREQK